jgi:ABC-type branched-subunit amino acid transport system substrate-binding protein
MRSAKRGNWGLLRRFWAISGYILLAVQGLPPALAQEATPGVDATRILFGQSAVLTGPASALGQDMRTGLLAAFAEVNRAGGIDGRMLELISYDDAYEPETAIENTLKLIEQDRVFALIGGVGTPTAAAAQPLAEEAGVPFIGPFTGAEFLRDPGHATVVNVRASYYQETEQIVDWLVRDRGVGRIAVLYQDDTYGRAGLAGVRRALDRRNMTLAGEGAYQRNTTAVKRALLAIRRASPDAIVIIGAYEPSASFIRWARKLGMDATIVNVSFVGTNALVAALGPDGAGTFISQVVPPPDSNDLPLTAEYRASLAANDPSAPHSFVSLEGYLVGRLTARVLERAAKPLTRESFLEALRSERYFSVGGFEMEYGPLDNQGSDKVFLTEIDEAGRVVPVARSSP